MLDSFDFSQQPLPPLTLSERSCPFGAESITREVEDPIASDEDDPD